MVQTNRVIRFLAGAVFSVVVGLVPTPLWAVPSDGDSHTVTLAVFSVNDFHGSFLADADKGIPGVVALCHTLDSLKQAYPYHVTVAAGDNFGGSYFSTVTEAALLPVMFNKMGITVSAIGNHEFDNGQDFLARRWAGAPMRPAGWDLTYVCANVTDSLGRTPGYVRPFAVREVKLSPTRSANVAFVGLITSSTPEQTRASNVRGLVFDGRYDAVLDMLKTARGFDSVRNANVRLLLTHIGTRMEGGKAVWDDRDAAHLEAINDTLYHGILSAHSHQPVCGTVSQRHYPVVQGEWHGDYIGVMKVQLDTMSMRVVGAEPVLERVPLGRCYTDAEAQAWNCLIDSLMNSTRIAGGYPLGRVLATSEVLLTHDRADKHTFTELGTLVCESYAEAYRRAAGAADGDVVVGVCHYGTVRAPLPKGDVRVMDVGEVLPFSNRIRTFRMTGAELMRLVEFGLNNRRYGRMQFDGLEVLADSADTFRVRSLRYVQPSGKRRVEIKPETPCVVAADEFMTTGGDGYPTSLFPDVEEIKSDLPTTTEAFIQHIERLGKVHGDPDRVRKLFIAK